MCRCGHDRNTTTKSRDAWPNLREDETCRCKKFFLVTPSELEELAKWKNVALGGRRAGEASDGT